MLTPCLESCFICFFYHLGAYPRISAACRVWQVAAVCATWWNQAVMTEFYQLCHLICLAQSHLLGEKTKSFRAKVLNLLSTGSQPLICLNSPLPCSSCNFSPSFPWLPLLQRTFLLPAFPHSWRCKCKQCWPVVAQRMLSMHLWLPVKPCTKSRRHWGPPARLFWVISYDLS